MRKLIYIVLLFVSNVAFGQADVIRTAPVTSTGANFNKQAVSDANLKIYQSFRLPRHPSNGLYGAKDTSGYVYWNTTISKVIVYKGSGLYDTLSTSVSTAIYKLASDSVNNAGYVTHGYLNSHSGTIGSPLTVNKSGTGDASPFTFNGSVPKTISYNSIGAQSDLKVINALDYGVVADSVTDNNTALTAMIAACPAKGCEILLPAGKIFTSGTLTFTHPVTLIGQGGVTPFFGTNGAMAVTTLISNKTTGDFVTVNANNCLFQNVAFYNNATPTAGTGIMLIKSTGFRMLNCSVFFFYNNIDFENGYDWAIDGSIFFRPRHWNIKIADVALADAGDQSISNTWFYSNITTAGVAQMEYESGGGLKQTNVKYNTAGGSYDIGINVAINATTVDFLMSNCSIENANSKGINISSSVPYANISITGSEIASDLPIYIDGTIGGGTISNISITGNILQAGSSSAAVTIYNASNATVGPNAYFGGTPFDIVSVTPVNIVRPTYIKNLTGTTPTYDINQSNFQFITLTGNTTMSLANIQNGDTWTLLVAQNGAGGHTLSIPGSFTIGENPLDTDPGAISYIVGHQNIITIYSNVSSIPTNYWTTNSTQTGLTGNKTTTGILNTSGALQANGGVTPDGMSPISTTMPGDANSYAYFGMTRSGITAAAIGLDNLNAFIIGTGPTRGNGAIIDTPLFRLNTHNGNLMLYGTLSVPGTTSLANYYTTSGTPTFALGGSTIVGSGASMSVSGTNQDGEITLTTGTGVSATGILFTITLNGFAYPTKCTPVLTAEIDASTTRFTVGSLANNSFTYSSNGTNLSSSTTYKFTYHNGGY